MINCCSKKVTRVEFMRGFYNRLLTGWTLVLLFCICFPMAAHGAQVVVITAEGMTIDDINSERMPFLYRLASEGAVGLMNPKTGGRYTRENAFMTLSAGRPAVGHDSGGRAFNVSEKAGGSRAGDIYTARTGKPAPERGIVYLPLQRTLENNRYHKTGAVPGLLGEALKQAGISCAVIGNADIPGEYHREAVSIVMDRWGRVPAGNVSRELLTAGKSLLWRTDFDRLFRQAVAFSQTDLLVIDTGDLTRLELVKDDTIPAVWQRERQRALQRIDDFVRRLTGEPVLQDAVLVFVSPQPSRAALKAKNFFVPLIVRGGGLTGLLTSGTTRRPGIVANTDLTASILGWLHADIPPQVTGRRLQAVPGTRPVETLNALNREAVFVYRTRPPLIKGYVLLQIVVICLALAALLLRRRLLSRLRPVLLALMAVPVSLLLVVLLPAQSFPIYVAGILGLVSVIVLLGNATAGHHELAPFVLISFLTAAAILADLLLGAPLMQHSTLGYDAMAGARYYGIGNEYMGVLVGSSVVGAAALYQWVRRWRRLLLVVSMAFFACTVSVIAAPQLGTNFGGTLASAAAFGSVSLGLAQRRLHYRTLLLGAAVLALAAVSLAVYDLSRPAAVQSHLGRMAGRLVTDGPIVLWDVAVRKINMNLKLIRWTIWSRVFLVFLIALTVLALRPVGILRKIAGRYPYFFRGLAAVVVGSGVALLTNDSGIVAAATMMIFAAAPLLYMAAVE